MQKNYSLNFICYKTTFLVVLSLFLSVYGNAQAYKLGNEQVLSIQKEIENAQTLINKKTDNSYQEGIDLFSKIEAKVSQTNDTLFILDFYKIRIESCLSNFDYDDALNYTNKGFLLLKKYDNKRYLGIYYELLGVIKYSQEKNLERDNAFFKAEYYLRNFASPEENIDINFNLAVISKEKQNWTSTQKYALEALRLIKVTQTNQIRKKYLYTFLAEANLNLENLQQTDFYLRKLESDKELLNNKLLLVASYYGLRARYFEKNNDFKKASYFFNKSNETYAKLSFEKTKQIKESFKLESNLQLKDLENQKIKKEIELSNANNRYKNFLILLSVVLIVVLVILMIFQKRNFKLEEKMNTLLKNKNEELEETNEQIKLALKSKKNFLDTITHELRTPLNSIKGISYLLANEKGEKNMQLYTETLAFSSDYLLSLINNIIEFNIFDKIKSYILKSESVNLRELLNNVVNSFKIKNVNQNKFKVEIDKNIPHLVNTDSFVLSQIILNLIDNAAKFTKNGEILLRVELAKEQEENITLHFEISDSGIGIDEKIIEQVFIPFFQETTEFKNQYEGVGLGLSIVNKALKLFNSEPKLTSQKGLGTTISFELELKKIIASNIPNKIKEIKVNYNDVSILLVEDNKVNQAITKKILLNKGFQCDVADNGLEAVEKVEKNDYSLILMDIMMPIMDGFESSERITKIKPNIPIIALTAVYEEINKDRFEKAKIRKVLNKPVKIETLYTTILNYVN